VGLVSRDTLLAFRGTSTLPGEWNLERAHNEPGTNWRAAVLIGARLVLWFLVIFVQAARAIARGLFVLEGGKMRSIAVFFAAAVHSSSTMDCNNN